MKKTEKQPVFKPYDQHQMSLFPLSLEELLGKDHPARLVNSLIDKLDLSELYRSYPGGGSSSYNPGMLLKVMVYAYLTNIYSSRKIESALTENIAFMWLSGMQRPDHRTLNRFRKARLAKVFKKLFTETVMFFSEQKLLTIQELYLDGTKIHANANRYSFVWAKNIEHNRERIEKQLEQLWMHVNALSGRAEENRDVSVPEGTIPEEKIKETVERLNKVLKEQAEEITEHEKKKDR